MQDASDFEAMNRICKKHTNTLKKIGEKNENIKEKVEFLQFRNK